MFDVTNMSRQADEPSTPAQGLTADAAEVRQKLSGLQDRFIDSWGELATIWGTQRSGGRMHSLLYINPDALCAEDIGDRLQISHGNTSTTVRQLLSAGVIRRMHRPGERRAYFSSEPDPWQWMKNTVQQRRERELMPVVRLMRELIEQLNGLEREAPRDLLPELKATHEKVQTFLTFLEQLMAIIDGFVAPSQRS
jgi:DNA-binding transcriptional regulator GbsR (MarR family)